MAAAVELTEQAGEFCDACKRRLVSERLAAPGR